jgi:hypothetical protein
MIEAVLGIAWSDFALGMFVGAAVVLVTMRSS